MSRAKDVRKSNFTTITSLLGTDYMDIVRSGQNLKITLTNALTFFGVSGPLEAKGEVTATPVLDVDAGTNYIRNLAAGAGIALSLTAQEAIQIDHNFTISKVGDPLILNELTTSPTVVSLVAGTGITLTPSGSTIEIASSGPAGSKTVQVYDSGDFPAPSLGIITLADDTEYVVYNDITLSDRFIFGNNTVLRGSDSVVINLTYTGAGVMFTISDKNMKIRDMYLTCANGTLFDWDASTATFIFRMFNCGVSCQNFGDFNGGSIIFFDNINIYSNTGTGITFAGAINVLLMHIVGWTKAAGAQDLIDFGAATFYSITLNKMLFTNNGTGYCVTGAAASANINAGGVGSIINILKLGTGNLLQNIDGTDDRWITAQNAQIANSVDTILSTRGAGTVAISVANTPVIVAGTWTNAQAHRFTDSLAGRWTYTGLNTHIGITATISASITTATDSVTFYLYKNGVQIAASAVTRVFTAGTIGNLSLIWEDEATNGDYYEIWVENDDTTVDIEIDKIVMRIRS